MRPSTVIFMFGCHRFFRDLSVEFSLDLCYTRAKSSVLTLTSTGPANALHQVSMAGWFVVLVAAATKIDAVHGIDDGVRVTLEGEDIFEINSLALSTGRFHFVRCTSRKNGDDSYRGIRFGRRPRLSGLSSAPICLMALRRRRSTLSGFSPLYFNKIMHRGVKSSFEASQVIIEVVVLLEILRLWR